MLHDLSFLSRQTLKTALYKLGLDESIDHLQSYFSTSRRNRFKQDKRSYLRLYPQLEALKVPAALANSTERPSLLFLTYGNFNALPYELVVCYGFLDAGYAVTLVIPPNRYLHKAWNVLGFRNIIKLRQFTKLVPRLGEANHALSQLNSLQELLSLSAEGVLYGKYATSVMMRRTRMGSLDIDIKTPQLQADLVRAIANGLEAVDLAQNLVTALKIDAVMMYDRGYTPCGELFDLCLKRNIPAFSINSAHCNNALILNRYTAQNPDAHPYALSDQTWQTLQAMDWTESHWQALKQELEGTYNSGEWYGEVGTQVNSSAVTHQQLLQQLKLDTTKKTAILFPHIFWDATFFWGEDLFSDYEAWFAIALERAIANDRLNWLVKVHPAIVTKNKRDGYQGQSSERDFIAQNLGQLPSHVQLIDADTAINTWSLYQVADYCLTVRGTVGIEAACLGITVLTAGTGRYDRRGFTVDSDSPAEYLHQLDHLEEIPKPSPEQIELARRFAYGSFLLRPLRLKAVDMQYEKTELNTLVTNFVATSRDEFLASGDVQALSTWIQSGRADYIQPPDD